MIGGVQGHTFQAGLPGALANNGSGHTRYTWRLGHMNNPLEHHRFLLFERARYDLQVKTLFHMMLAARPLGDSKKFDEKSSVPKPVFSAAMPCIACSRRLLSRRRKLMIDSEKLPGETCVTKSAESWPI